MTVPLVPLKKFSLIAFDWFPLVVLPRKTKSASCKNYRRTSFHYTKN